MRASVKETSELSVSVLPNDNGCVEKGEGVGLLNVVTKCYRVPDALPVKGRGGSLGLLLGLNECRFRKIGGRPARETEGSTSSFSITGFGKCAESPAAQNGNVILVLCLFKSPN